MCVVNVAEEAGGGAGWISMGRRGNVADIGGEGLVRLECGLGDGRDSSADAVDSAILLGGEAGIEGDCGDTRRRLSGDTCSIEGDLGACADWDAVFSTKLFSVSAVVVGGGCESGTTLGGVSKESDCVRFCREQHSATVAN
jgi:hypothetical protein